MIPHVRFFGASIVIATLLVTLAACSGGPKRQLRMNLPPGSAYELTIRTTLDLLLTMSGNTKEAKVDSTTRLLCRVASVYENGDMLANITIEDMGAGLGMASQSKIVAGAEFSARISPLGEVVQLLGTDEMRHVLLAKSADKSKRNEEKPERNPEEYITKRLTDDQLRVSLELALRVWPAVPVAVGDVWESGQLYDPNNDVFVTRTFTLESWDPAIVTVSFESVMSPAERQPDVHFSGTGAGEVRISPVEGTVKSARFTRTYSGTSSPSPDIPLQVDGQGTYQIEFVAR